VAVFAWRDSCALLTLVPDLDNYNEDAQRPKQERRHRVEATDDADATNPFIPN